MPKKRRLTDLYIIGAEEVFDDGNGDPITVFVRKLSAVDQELALRKANAARSRSQAIKNDPDGEDYLALAALVADYTRDDLVSYLTEDLKSNRAAPVEERRADDDEWKTESYLQGLKDAWEEGLDKTFIEDPADPEARRVFEEIKRFDQQVTDDLQHEVDDLTETLADRPIEDLRSSVLDKLISVRASLAWLNEYRRCEVWLSIRDVDHKARYFTSRAEVDDLPDEVYGRLLTAYRAISVDPTEGKDSAATQPSSPLSEQPEKVETDESSGPTGAAA